MNYLAHIFLAEDNLESQLGNFLGDFIKGVDRTRFPEAIQQGIQSHLKIDAFTDDHPVFKQSRARLSSDRRRFAGVIVDIFYDHFLALHWDYYCDEPLADFSDRVIGEFLAYPGYVPEKARFVLERLNENGRLVSYREPEAIGYVLDGMSARFPRKNTMAGSLDELLKHYNAFEQDFFAFFPEVRDFAREIAL